jgi:hypothetical protein
MTKESHSKITALSSYFDSSEDSKQGFICAVRNTTGLDSMNFQRLCPKTFSLLREIIDFLVS